MRRPLAGKAAFYAMGQRAATQGLTLLNWYDRVNGFHLPFWAKAAFLEGYCKVAAIRRAA